MLVLHAVIVKADPRGSYRQISAIRPISRMAVRFQDIPDDWKRPLVRGRLTADPRLGQGPILFNTPEAACAIRQCPALFGVRFYRAANNARPFCEPSRAK